MMLEKKSFMKSSWGKPSVITIVMFALVLLPTFFMPENLISTLTKIAIMALFAVSLNMQLGFADLPALGQVMYFGGGAYVFTLLTTRANMSILPSFFLTIAIFVALSMFIGFICLRSGTLFGFIFLNMGISLLIWSFVNKWMWIGADGGLLNTPVPVFATTIKSFHVFTVAVVGISIILLYLLRRSPFMTVLEGSRENDQRLLFLGVSIRTVKWYIHVLSSIFTVIAGMLFAMRNQGAYPSYLVSLLSTEIVIACIIGGKNNFMGPVLGAAIVTTINTSVSNATIYYQLILGVIIIISVFFLRGGILPGLSKHKDQIFKVFRPLKAIFAGGKGTEK